MGALIASHNWSDNPLGPIESWPENLRATVSLIVMSRFPMLIFWGPELITIYNDALRLSLGNDGKHPGSLGQRGEESWAESWPTIGPMIYNIMSGGEPVWFEDQKLPLYRDGQLGYAYWTYSFSPVRNGSGDIEGLLVTCAETTRAVESLEQLKDANRRLEASLEENKALQEEQRLSHLKVEQSQRQLLSLFNQSPVALATLSRNGLTFTSANAFYGQLVGRAPEDIIGKTLLEALPEIAGQGFDALLNGVLDTGVPFVMDEAPVALMRDGTLETIYVNFAYQPMRDEAGGINAVLVVVTDVSSQVMARKKTEESEERLRSVIDASPAAIGLLAGRELILEHINQSFVDFVGRDWSIVGKPLGEALPELESDGSPILRILDDVFTQGIPFSAPSTLVRLMHQGVLEDRYFNLSYTPLRDATGSIYAVLTTSIDVTAQSMAQQQLEASETKLRSIVETAPVAIGLFVGRDLIIENPNQTFIDIVGKGWGVEGLPLREAMPELITEGQPFLKILDDVYTTGVPFLSPASMVKIVQNGVMTSRYYNISYSPVYNAAGEIYAVLDVAVDVTEQIEARQQVDNAQAALASAIEVAELGTWTFHLSDNMVEMSQRFADIFGVDALLLSFGEVVARIHPDDLPAVQAGLERAMTSGWGGKYEEIYRIIQGRSGRQLTVHALGRTVFDAEGVPLHISGTIRDITMERELQAALEAQVQERTEQLRATNEELAESNAQLQHSNDELAQYAYVASHDLQEPLRKIRVFTGMLGSTAGLPAATRTTIDKISRSAERMSLLIQDLLAFSRLLKSDTLMRPVPLRGTVADVWNDFELIVAEKQATLEIGELPVIEAVNLQMNQLFYNLIGNALKFSSDERPPHIVIDAQQASLEEVQAYIPKPLPFATYYHIRVRDNGIGFELQYHEQIFEVFKRLHGRDHFPGSGIGLSICRRIVANHSGYLYAVSEQEAGSVFHILLPDRQSDVVSMYEEAGPPDFTHMG